MDRKTIGLTLLSLVLVAAIAGGALLVTRAANLNQETVDDLQSNYNTQLAVVTSTVAETTTDENITADVTTFAPGRCEGFMGPMQFGRHGRGSFGGFGMGGFGQIEVSDEYKASVSAIAQADTDVKELLSDGYNVTRIMPIAKTTIDGEGNISTKATNATVILTKEDSGFALVSIDLTQNKVTQIIIHTRTVIEK